jgi:hypothetical protein
MMMNYKSKLKLLIKTLIILVIPYILINKSNVSNRYDIINKKIQKIYKKSENFISEYSSKNQENSLENNDFEKAEERVYYKPNNTNWEKLEPLIYFKRSLGYYFTDKQLVRSMFVTHFEQNKFNFTIEMNIYKNDHLIANHWIQNVRTEMETFRREHLRMYSMYFTFKQDSLETERDNFINNPKDFKMEIFIRNNENNHRTQSPIELKIKNMRKAKNDPKVEYAMVCSKCIQFSDDSLASSLKWWFELHRQIGYSKFRFCNNSIPNTPAYNDVFYE